MRDIGWEFFRVKRQCNFGIDLNSCLRLYPPTALAARSETWRLHRNGDFAPPTFNIRGHSHWSSRGHGRYSAYSSLLAALCSRGSSLAIMTLAVSIDHAQYLASA